MNDFRIALLGLGTVGTAVAELLATTRDECLARAERPVVVDRIIVRNLDRPRSIPEDLPGKKVLSSDPMDAVHDPEIDAIVELVGGEDHQNPGHPVSPSQSPVAATPMAASAASAGAAGRGKLARLWVSFWRMAISARR